MYESFKDYATALQEIVKSQLPDLMEKSKDLPSEAEEVKSFAEPEFGRLDPMKKAKALIACALNLKLVAKIPTFVK